MLRQKEGSGILDSVVYREKQLSPPVVLVYAAAERLIVPLKIVAGYAVINYGSGGFAGSQQSGTDAILV